MTAKSPKKRKTVKKKKSTPKSELAGGGPPQQDIALKYRPQHLHQVVGNADAVASLRDVCDTQGVPNATLLHGPPGVGKTTIARILAQRCGAEGFALVEVDGASANGVDAARDLAKWMSSPSLLAGGARCIIVDEAMRLSKNAWEVLLKSVEEPPPGCHWVFCCTDITSIPKAIKSRCYVYQLHPVTDYELFNLLGTISTNEEWPVGDDAIEYIVELAEGSPRTAIKMLGMAYNAHSREDAAKICSQLENTSQPVLELCRWAGNGSGHINELQKHMKQCKNENPEEVRLALVRYLTTVALSKKKPTQVMFLVNELCTHRPYPSNEGIAPVMSALCRGLYGYD